MARIEKDTDFLAEWNPWPEKIAESFLKTYWDEEKGYLADVENGLYTDWSIRPNMVLAAAMPESPLSQEQKIKILEKAKHDLLTSRGLRTLSPNDPAFKGIIEGTPDQREEAAHRGTVYPWLLQFYAEAWFSAYGKAGIPAIRF
jgi:predicted glycogen debranching enzyme